jgi:hypothetical protein
MLSHRTSCARGWRAQYHPHTAALHRTCMESISNLLALRPQVKASWTVWKARVLQYMGPAKRTEGLRVGKGAGTSPQDSSTSPFSGEGVSKELCGWNLQAEWKACVLPYDHLFEMKQWALWTFLFLSSWCFQGIPPSGTLWYFLQIITAYNFASPLSISLRDLSFMLSSLAIDLFYEISYLIK